MAAARGAARCGRDRAERARPAPPRDARRARADVRQVRAAALDAPGHRPAGHHHGAPRAPGRRQAVPVRPGRGRDPEELELPVEKFFLEFEETPMAAASIGQVHRAVLPNGQRVAVKVQRPDAPRQIEADLALLYQAARSRRSACVRSTSSTRASSSTSSRARSGRSSTTARRPQRADVPPQLRRPPARPHPARLLELHAQRVLTLELLDGIAARRHRARATTRSRSGAPRLPADRGVDDDDLPPRLLPRRPAPGEHPRPRPGDRSASSTSARPGSSATTTCPS